MSLQRAELSRPQVDPARPVGPQVLSILRHRIITSELPPGTRISEAEVAALYGVSRQPVREAFIKLADEDLVEVRPQRGTFVRKIVVAAVQDARFVREAIEADIVTLIAATPDRALVDDLRQQIVAQRQVIGGDPSDFIPLDDRFHRTLAEAAGRPFGWTVIEGMKSQMDRVRQLSTVRFPLERLIGQHAAIVEAIASGRADTAEAAMRTHLRGILDDLPRIQAAMPDYFEAPRPAENT
ncbi:MAG: GntR family transcriptional regulator [Roseicyclus sp.]|jgi:DNA-binding GntR family transcriptional regulator|nr:GntR family transcriptional regulator [Roseicyclus sp.]